MVLKLEQHERHRCSWCSSSLGKRGYVVEDSAGVQLFLCLGHTTELVSALCEPEGPRRWTPSPAGSAEEYAETARVVGYRPGLGSCISREE